MTFNEKKLYHQIHPLKLFVDISSGFLTTYLSWQHNWFWFLSLMVIPSLITSYLLMWYVNLESLKSSKLGNYLKKYMTNGMEAFRFSGQIIMWIAAWYHLLFLIVIGFLMIAGGWFSGVIITKTHSK